MVSASEEHSPGSELHLHHHTLCNVGLGLVAQVAARTALQGMLGYSYLCIIVSTGTKSLWSRRVELACKLSIVMWLNKPVHHMSTQAIES